MSITATENLIKNTYEGNTFIYLTALNEIREWWHDGEDNSHDVCELLQALQHDIQAIAFPQAVGKGIEWEERARELGYDDDNDEVVVEIS